MSAPDPVLRPAHLKDLLKRRGPAALAVGVLTFVTVVGVTLWLTPMYESRASLRIEPLSGAGGLPEGLSLGLPGLGALGGDAQVVTEMGILGSRRMLEPIAQQLALHVTIDEPAAVDGVREPVFAQVNAGADAPRAELTFTRESDGSYRITASELDESVSVPATARPGESVVIGDLTLVLDSVVTAPVIRVRSRPLRSAMRSIERTLRIRRDEPQSRLVHLRFRHPETRVAKAFLDGVLAIYLDEASTLGASDPARKVEFLDAQVAGYRQQVSAAERRLLATQEAAGGLLPLEELEFEMTRRAELTVRLDAFEVEATTLDQFLAGAVGPQALLAFPTFLEAGSTSSVLEAIIELESQRDELLARRSAQNLDVRVLQARITALEERLQDQVKGYRAALQQRVVATTAALDSLAPSLKPLPARIVAVERARRELELVAELTAKLEVLAIQARSEQALTKVDTRVIDAGTISDRPVYPRLDINVILGAVLAGLLALIVLLTGGPSRRPTDA